MAGLNVTRDDPLGWAKRAAKFNYGSETFDGLFDLLRGVKRFQEGFAGICPLPVFALDIITLHLGRVAQDKTCQVSRRSGGMNITVITILDEKRKSSDVIQMCVSYQYRIQAAGE